MQTCLKLFRVEINTDPIVIFFVEESTNPSFPTFCGHEHHVLDNETISRDHVDNKSS